MANLKKVKIKKPQSKKKLKQEPDLDTYQFDTSKYIKLSSYKFKLRSQSKKVLKK